MKFNTVVSIFKFFLEIVKRHPIPYPLINILLMIRWRSYIHPFARIGYPYNVRIGPYSIIGKCRIVARSTNRFFEKTVIIGSKSIIFDDTLIASQGGLIKIGDNVSLHNFSIVYGLGGVSIGNDTRIAASTLIISSNHSIDDPRKKISDSNGMIKKGIFIGNDCWIGAGSRILDGVHVGDRAVVGAGSVITKDVASATVVAGVPAKFIKNRFR